MDEQHRIVTSDLVEAGCFGDPSLLDLTTSASEKRITLQDMAEQYVAGMCIEEGFEPVESTDKRYSLYAIKQTGTISINDNPSIRQPYNDTAQCFIRFCNVKILDDPLTPMEKLFIEDTKMMSIGQIVIESRVYRFSKSDFEKMFKGEFSK